MANDFHNIDIHYMNSNEIPNTTGIDSDRQVHDVQNHYPTSNIFDGNSVNHVRLNGLDSAILEEESYRNLDDDVLKTEYQITKLNKDLEVIESEINNAKNINDYQKVDILTIKKHSIQNKLKQLHNDYKCSDVTTHLSENLSNILAFKPDGLFDIIGTCGNFIRQNILRKVFKHVNSGENVKEALNKLETLNKNVDELVTMQTPYGESEERYEMLTQYLNRANVIHYNISKTIGSPTFFDSISSIDKEKLKAAQKEKSNFGNMAKRNRA